MYKLTEINIYPIKSLGGISLQSSVVEERGLKYDRRWVLVDETKTFFTQRDFPEMALIKVEIETTGLKLQHKTKNIEQLFIPFEFKHSISEQVVIWDDTVMGDFYNDQIDQWFSDILGINCRLVKMPDSTQRIIDKKYAKNKIVSFADAFPLLIIGEESLADLNKKMEVPLPMNRFRTNLVFSGGNPFDEDRWKGFQVGDVNFKAVKACSRCVITTTNQDTAEKADEPLKTLATYRRQGNNVMFGMNVIPESLGEITVGENIKLLG